MPGLQSTRGANDDLLWQVMMGASSSFDAGPRRAWRDGHKTGVATGESSDDGLTKPWDMLLFTRRANPGFSLRLPKECPSAGVAIRRLLGRLHLQQRQKDNLWVIYVVFDCSFWRHERDKHRIFSRTCVAAASRHRVLAVSVLVFATYPGTERRWLFLSPLHRSESKTTQSQRIRSRPYHDTLKLCKRTLLIEKGA